MAEKLKKQALEPQYIRRRERSTFFMRCGCNHFLQNYFQNIQLFLSFWILHRKRNIKKESRKIRDIFLQKRIGGFVREEMIGVFQKAYPGKHPTDLLFIDRVMRQPSKAIAKLHASGRKAGTYLYDFTLEFPIHHNKIAWHCSDIPFFFHNTELVEVCQIPDVAERLEVQMSEAFISFARTGKPESDKLPVWESVTEEKEPTMIFDRECEVRYNFDDELYQKIDDILPPFNLMEMMAKGAEIQH